MSGIKDMSKYHTRNLKSGVIFWLRHRKLPEGAKFRAIGRLLDRMRNDLITDLGGVESMSTQEKLMIDNTIVCQGVVMLGAADLKESGVLNPDGDVRPILKMLATYANSVRLNLMCLGMNKRLVDAKIKNYEEWLDAHGEEAAENEKS